MINRLIIIKDENSINKMKKSGKILSLVSNYLKKQIVPGISLLELDFKAEKKIREYGATPSFKGYKGFPCSICTSVEEEVIHGIPSNRKLKEGEIVSIDIGVFYSGFHTDSAFTVPVGTVTDIKKKLINIAEKSFFECIKFAKIGKRIGDISNSIQSIVEKSGFSVVKEFAGHGVGEKLHEDPSIPNYGFSNRGPRLEYGMTLAIEPMVNMGSSEIEILNNGWTVVTKDKKPSSHFEHSILITENNPYILTMENVYD